MKYTLTKQLTVIGKVKRRGEREMTKRFNHYKFLCPSCGTAYEIKIDIAYEDDNFHLVGRCPACGLSLARQDALIKEKKINFADALKLHKKECEDLKLIEIAAYKARDDAYKEADQTLKDAVRRTTIDLEVARQRYNEACETSFYYGDSVCLEAFMGDPEYPENNYYNDYDRELARRVKLEKGDK